MSSRIPSLAEIQSPEEALEMSACRNQVRTFMTHNTEEILPHQQIMWYWDEYLPRRAAKELIGYVVRDEDQEPLGYGLISERRGRYWVSGGLNADARGKGAGRALFEGMTNTIHEELGADAAWLDVNRGNERAISLYRSLGYRAVSDTADLIVMVHRVEPEDLAA